MKHWISASLATLRDSLSPTPHELNELDWKVRCSDNKERLAEHLMAFANYPGGGTLVVGVTNDGRVLGVTEQECSDAVNTIANLGRHAVEPPIAIDHAQVEFEGTNVLLIHVPEQRSKPCYRRGKGLEETWVRSGGTTRKASRQEVGGLMLNSSVPRWEELRASQLLPLSETLALLDLETIARLLGRPLPSTEEELAGWITAEGLATKEGNGFYVTNFGAVAAAKRFDDFPELERKRIRLIRYRGRNKVDTIDEIAGQKGYAVGFELLIQHLGRVLPHSEVIQRKRLAMPS